MKITLNAFIYDHSLALLSPQSLKDERKVLEQCSFTQYKTPKNAVLVGQVEVEVELAPPDQIMQGMVAMLRNKQETIKQEARDQVNEIEVQVQNLLALPAPDSGA